MSHTPGKFEDTKAFELKERLKNGARDDKKKRIDALWDLLLKLHEDGETDYSVTRIGKALEEAGIQKLQSYRNAQSQHYRDIVEQFATDVGGRTKHQHNAQVTPLMQAVESIDDLDTKIRLKCMMEDLKRCKHENQVLRNELSKRQLIPYGGKSNSGHAASNNAPALTAPQHIIKPAVDSVKKFLSEDWLDANGLIIKEDGTVCYDNNPITLAAFAKQLEAMIRYVENS